MFTMRLHRLFRVYTCQNATLLEISCNGSNLYKALRFTVMEEILYLKFLIWKDDGRICSRKIN